MPNARLPNPRGVLHRSAPAPPACLQIKLAGADSDMAAMTGLELGKALAGGWSGHAKWSGGGQLRYRSHASSGVACLSAAFGKGAPGAAQAR